MTQPDICATLDLETLSRKPTAAFDQIGIVFFDTRAPLPSLDSMVASGHAAQFDIYVDSYKRRHLHIEQDTLDWRAKDGTPIANPAPGNGHALRAAIQGTRDLIQIHKPRFIFLQGKDFDAPILKNACDELGIKPPWGDDYWRIKCSRDCIQWEFSDKTRVENLTGRKNTHGALDDAYNQACAMQIALRHRRRKQRVYAPASFIERLLRKVQP